MGIETAFSIGAGLYGMYKDKKTQDKIKTPKSAEELEAEAKKKTEAKRQARAKGRAKYGKTNYSSATGVSGQEQGLKDKVGQ